MLAQALSTSAPASCSRGVQYRRKEHAQARPRVALGSRAVHGDAFATQSGQRRRHSLRKRFSVKAVISDRPPATEVQAEQKKSSGKFDWYNQWYPVCVTDRDVTSPAKPHQIQLLGKDLVVWYDGSKWRCFEDKCPHRLAPLSEGRVEKDGSLLCSYHAWRFDGTGACTAIPQIPKAAEPAVRASPRACAVAYPTAEWQGLLFVFASPDAARAEQTPIPKIPELEDENLTSGFTTAPAGWGFRDLPYGWEAFFENVTDAAHVPVSHHGIIGNRYKDAKPMTISVVEPVHRDGFRSAVTGADLQNPGKRTGMYTFAPPSLLRIDSVHNEDGSSQNLVLYCTPTRPGWCRNIGMTLTTRATKGPAAEAAAAKAAKAKPKPPFSKMFKAPYWVIHPLASLFYHQDLVFLHGQQVFLDQVRRTQGRRWAEACFMPGGFDKTTSLFREWLEEHGVDGRVPWAPECDPSMPPLERDPRKLFDVYTQHTKSCAACQASVRRLTVARAALCTAAAVAAVFAVGVAAAATLAAAATATSAGAAGAGVAAAAAVSAAAVSAAGRNAALATSGWALLAAAALLLLAYGVHRFRRMYFLVEFSHQDNN